MHLRFWSVFKPSSFASQVSNAYSVFARKLKFYTLWMFQSATALQSIFCLSFQINWFPKSHITQTVVARSEKCFKTLTWWWKFDAEELLFGFEALQKSPGGWNSVSIWKEYFEMKLRPGRVRLVEIMEKSHLLQPIAFCNPFCYLNQATEKGTYHISILIFSPEPINVHEQYTIFSYNFFSTHLQVSSMLKRRRIK